MLKSFFQRRSKLDHPDPQVRIRALNDDPKLTLEQFAKIARDDRDLGVRRVALSKANSLELYEELLDEEELSDICRKFLIDNIDDNHPLALDPRILPMRLQSLTEPAKIYDLAQRLGSSAETAGALAALPTPKLREEVLSLCFDEDVLGELQKLSRHQNKSVNRFVRDRLNAFKELRNRKQNLTAQAEHIIGAAIRSLPHDPHYTARREKIEREWEHTLEAIEQLNAQLAANAHAEIDIDALKSEFPNRAEPSAIDAGGPQQFEGILTRLRECSNNDENEIDECERLWLDALKEQPAPRAIADQFYQLANSKRREIRETATKNRQKLEIEALIEPIMLQEPGAQSQSWFRVWSTRSAAQGRLRKIERYQERLAGTGKTNTLADETSALTEMVPSLKSIIERCNELEEETIRHVESNLESLSKFIDSGSLKKAKSAERNISALINRLPKRQQGTFNARLAPAITSIRQLSGWQEFAEEPKRIALCEAIEELANNPLSPEDQFHKIRELRERWNGLGMLRSRDERSLQDRYDKAAEKAFQICESWFNEQAAMRQRNFEGRQEICRRLQSFVEEYDWEKPDFKVVHRMLRSAQSEWRSFTPIERTKSKSINASFGKLTRELESRLADHWSENSRQKEEIIDEAKTAVEDSSLSPMELIAAIKDLQARWKNVGPAGRRKEQGLWKNFRALCNLAFERREAQQQERRSQLDANIKTAQDEVAKLDQLLSNPKTTLQQLDSSLLNELRSKLSDLELPTRIRKSTENEISSLATQLNKRREELETRRSSEELIALIDIDIEIANLESDGVDPPNELLEKAGTGRPWFGARNAEDASKKAFALHELVLRAEVLADVPSPPEDAGKRMQVQVSRLQHGLTRGGESEEQKVERLIQAWCSTAHGDQPLRERFHNAIRKHLDDLAK
ncbi:MAG: DUF349 domain-containing protein [Gammaproteobacteria bacterium]|nr:DUF349 domain-containing protein [Gammaproteobacteria bacterium]